ncbi:hypothetical protein [Pedobacter nyackensis]|uniref:Uncharacterized protein n=1 Tax=Pedobacter nyackensis TaxID=475255 RepID=A0A1W2DAU0_9SPHI|nr:hypothetical protein [Pedobacter nyackensis]SMC94697.1 hypothetical protein SAMN04488101_106121 [Pedobacter nyackensis]
MKYYLYLITLFVSTNAFGQIKVTIGKNSPQFVVEKQPTFNAYSTADKDYFIISKVVSFQKINTLITVDKIGNIVTSKDISVNMGVSNSTVDVVDLMVFGNRSLIFLQNKSKADLKNQLVAKVVDINGNIATDATPIASMNFLKLSNGGKWYTSVTPDKKHLVIIGVSPHVKDAPDVVNYYILDENLKETAKGQFSFSGYTKELSFGDFLASDKGDFYMTSYEYDKSYIYPVVYKFSVGGTPMIIPVMITDPTLKNLSYTSALSPQGDLIIAGYTQKKASFVAGEIANNGMWLFNSSVPNEVKIFKAETAVQNIIARNIVYNGDTFFLIGEQYKKEEVKTSGTISPSQLSNPNYNYTHGDINVTAFSNDGSKKFEIPISRKMSSQNFDQELMVGTGVINNKLALIYNDQYNKYFEDKYHEFTRLKVPVAVLVTNDGLMEAPVQFSKELDIKMSSYTLLPQYTVSSNGKVTVLSANSQAVKTVTFSK